MNRREFVAGAVALGALSFAGCTHFADVTVGCKNFTEQLILGELIAQHLRCVLERKVDGRFYLAGSYICQQAILAGRIDTYVEYTGTALAAILKQNLSGRRGEVGTFVKDEYERRFGLEVFPSLGFDNSFAIVMRSEDAQRMGVRRLSELARVSRQLRMGVGYEFLDRIDGFKGMSAAYGLEWAAAPQVMDLGLIYRALLSKQVDVVAGSNTDGQIEALKLTVLQDDREFFPPYEAVPIVRAESLKRVAGLREAISELSGKISVEAMRRMNLEADGKKRDAAEIASEFLRTIA
jgi:osmoprotectant transport system substrate-binding protein